MFEDILKTEIQKAGVRNSSMQRRLTNINWIKNLNRAGLSYQDKQRGLLFKETQFGEKVYIQYPGKETVSSKGKGRPWDFRPKVYKNEKPLPDLRFTDIWADIIEAKEKTSVDNFRILATLFYRMAYILDHKLENFDNSIFEIENNIFNLIQGSIDIYDHNNSDRVSDQIRVGLTDETKLYIYKPDQNVLNHLNKSFGSFANMSIEAFLYYCELLSWNEDCKYYYRSFMKDPILSEKGKGWIKAVGRVNNILTVINIIGYVTGDTKLADIFGAFASVQSGVAPVSQKNAIEICSPYLYGNITSKKRKS